MHEDICTSIFLAVFVFIKDRRSLEMFSDRNPIKYITLQPCSRSPPAKEWGKTVCPDTLNNLQHTLSFKPLCLGVLLAYAPVFHIFAVYIKCWVPRTGVAGGCEPSCELWSSNACPLD